MRSAVGGNRLVLNQEAPPPVVGVERNFDMGESFVSRRPIVPLPTTISGNACVEHKLVGVVHNLLGRLGCRASVNVCDGIINMTPDDLNGVGGGVCLVEVLVVYKPVCVGDDIVGLVEVGKQIQRSGSAIPSAWPVFYP